MLPTSAILSIILIFLGSITLLLSYWTFNKRKLPGAVEFALFMLSVSIYAFGYALEIAHTELSAVLLAVKFEYLGIPYISYFVVLYSFRLATGRPLGSLLKYTLLIIPLLSTLLVFTVEKHTLFYIEPKIIEGLLFPVLTFKMGIFYIIRIIYQQLISLLSIFFLLSKISSADKIKRAHILALITAQIVPTIIFAFYFFNLIPGGLDVNPFSSFIVGTIFSFAILKLKLFEIVPHGREVALEAMGEAFILLDKHGVISDYNKTAKNLEFLNVNLGSTLPDDCLFTKKYNESLRDNVRNFDFNYVNHGNSSSFYKIKFYDLDSPLKRVSGRAIIITDVTDVMGFMEQLEYKATYDYLTDIRNRRFVIEGGIREIEVANRNKHPLSFIMVDIDYFKVINDTHGHIIGDKVLVEVATRLKNTLRNIDIIGRFGGEEFLILCPNTNLENANKAANRLKNIINEKTMDFDGLELDIHCSFGIYTYNGKGKSRVEDLIDRADKALYIAKESGRNRIHCLE